MAVLVAGGGAAFASATDQSPAPTQSSAAPAEDD